MQSYEYKVVPAPTKGTKAKGVKAPEARFAHMLQALMNEMGAEGWEYQRAETLPSEERKGLTGTATNWRHVLIFRRALHQAVTPNPQPVDIEVQSEPQPAAFASAPRPSAPPVPAPERVEPAAPIPRPAHIPEGPSARDTWTPEPVDEPKPAPSLNPLKALRKNPESSDA